MGLKKEKKFSATELNKYDRKILDKYTKYYSNFIESNTAKNAISEDEIFRGRD